jgi:hypothetical protein
MAFTYLLNEPATLNSAHALQMGLVVTVLFSMTLFATVCGAELGRPKAMQKVLANPGRSVQVDAVSPS